MLDLSGLVWSQAAWGAEGTGNADFGPAWKFLSADPQAINDQDEQGRTILHCCCALPDDAGRAVLLNNLLAAGADPRVEDKYGWSPSESDFVLEAEDKWNAWKHRYEREGEGEGVCVYLVALLLSR